MEKSFGLFYKLSVNLMIGSSINPTINYEKPTSINYQRHSINLFFTEMSLICLRYRY